MKDFTNIPKSNYTIDTRLVSLKEIFEGLPPPPKKKKKKKNKDDNKGKD